MPITQGEIPFPYQVQPDRRIVEQTDGTMDSTVEFWTNLSWQDHLPNIGDTHPDDRRLECHTREIIAATHQRVYAICHYKGLRDDPTDPTISYVGTPDREDVQTHPDWTTLAGTPAAPLNGATFIDIFTRGPTTKATDYIFHSFSANTSAELFGVQYYLKPSTQVNLTHWQTKVPEVQRMLIVDPSKLRPFRAPDDVQNFLLIDTPYRQVGSLYQVTKLYLGSGKNGWSTSLYPQP